MLHAVVHSAGLQDRDGGVLVMATLFGMFPFLRKLYAVKRHQKPSHWRHRKPSHPVTLMPRPEPVRCWT